MEDDHHMDFTTASDFEIFIARLEEVIRGWGILEKELQKPLEEDDFKTKEWCYSSESLTFSEAEFHIVRHHLKCEAASQEEVDAFHGEEEPLPQPLQDMMSIKNDFSPLDRPHPIARWYGLRDFILIIPEHASYVSTDIRRKIVLSGMTISSHNTNCGIPIFLQAMEPWQNYFMGIFQLGSFKTDFSMVHLKCLPKNFKEYSGLLYLFKTKIKEEKIGEVMLSVRHTYYLDEWVHTAWMKRPAQQYFVNDVLRSSELGSLPLGSNFDPTSELTLITIWPSVQETLLYKEQFIGSDNFDPIKAPVWKVSIPKHENLSCLLTDHFSEFVAVTKTESSISELLGNLIRGNESAGPSDLSAPLNVLTESKISAFSKAMIGVEKSSKKEKKGQSQQADVPISSENLMTILYYLFPDAAPNSMHPYSEDLGGKPSPEFAEVEWERNFDIRLSKMKSAPYDGLLWRLSVALSHVICWMGGVRSAAYVWYEFVQELRFRWENGILVPGLELDSPDFKTCLLNQKLQLLNCCISRKVEREKQAAKRNEGESRSDEEEEFYDCSAEVSDEDESDEGRAQRKSRIPPWDKPIGRLMQNGDLKLLKTGEPMYIPRTQGPVPKTEDQIEEYAEFLLQLGSDDIGSKMRAKLMSASLLSDMEAFKAANPGCILSDFIRWYSPRDWIEEDEMGEFGQKKGHLSDRMEIPGNTWLEVWQVAQPVPAMYQRRLFNDTKEAEKILDFLERRSPKEFIELLLPVMSTCVIQRLMDEPLVEELYGTSEILSKLIRKAELAGKAGKIDGMRYEELVNDINAIETAIVSAKYLKHKLTADLGEDDLGYEDTNESDLMEFIKELVAGEEAQIPEGPKSDIALKICCYFIKYRKGDVPSFLKMKEELLNEELNPFEFLLDREIILRVDTRQGPQRLHAVFKKNEYRLSGAFTENIYYKSPRFGSDLQTIIMAAAVQKNGVQTLPNGSHHLEMSSVECVSSSVSEPEAQEKHTEEEPAPEIDIVINNVVCSFSVRCHLNLKEIATYGANVEYRKENGMVTMKLRKPYTTASIWSSGKITCTGATSEDNAKIAARRFARSLQKLGFKVRFNNFRVVNVLGTCSMPFGIKITAFSAKYPKEAEYEPEIHPGVTYRLKEPKATLKIFSTGSITVTAPCVSSIAAAVEHIYPLVYEFRKERTKEDELDLELKKAKRNGARKRRRLDSFGDDEEIMDDVMDPHDFSDEEDSDWVIEEEEH